MHLVGMPYAKSANPYKRVPVKEDEKSVRVRWLRQQCDNYQKYWRPEIERYIRNGKMMWGINYGQWPQYVVQLMLDQGHRPPTYNVLQDKIIKFVSSMVGNGWDIEFSPVTGKLDTLCLKIGDMYYTDRVRMSWDFTELYAYLDMATTVAFERMFISDKFHYLGNVAWENLNPRHTLLDPRWKSNDCNEILNYFTWTRMTPDEIMESSPDDVSDRLKLLRDIEVRENLDYGEHDTFTLYESTDVKWNQSHRVIEYHWVESRDRWWEYDYRNKCDFPETGVPQNSPEDRQAKKMYIDTMGLTVDDVGWVRQKRRVKFIQRICPTIDASLFLINGKDKVQTNNCNIYPLGMRYEGQFGGKVDQGYDAQIAINKSELNMDEMQLRGVKDTVIADKALAKGDPALMQEIERKASEVGSWVWVDEGSLADLGPNGGIVPRNHAPITADMFNLSDRRYRYLDQVIMPAAQDSQTEHSGEPAALFNAKMQAMDAGNIFYTELIKNHKVEKARAWLLQAKITYSGYPRQFGGVEDAEPFEVNVPATDMMGRQVVLDDVSSVPEMNILANPAKNGQNMRTMLRMQFKEVADFVNTDPRNRLLAITSVAAIMDTLPLPDDKKAEIQKAADMLKLEAALQTANSIQQARANMATAEAQLTGQQQSQQPPQQEPTAQQVSYKKQSRPQMNAGTTQQANKPQPGQAPGQPQQMEVANA